jgi:GNAT superfamily N-acetyltransferase
MMDKEYQITYVEKPEESAWGIIGNGLDTFNRQQAGEYNFQRICFVLQDDKGTTEGGVLGEIWWNWLNISLLRVKEDLRGKGYGLSLLEAVEDEALKRGVKNAFLDTFSFQAPKFYEKYGYQVCGEIKGFPKGHSRIYMTKEL